MKTAIILLVALVPASFARLCAEEAGIVAEFSWSALSQADQTRAGSIENLPGREGVLKIENPGLQPLSATVLVIGAPGIREKFHVLSGEVRCEGVEGGAYLEMWSHFGGDEAYFTRTLGEAGPMGRLTGSADWRAFWLPFNAEGARGHPSKLVLNVVLPSKGTVWLGTPLTLRQEARQGTAGEWWSPKALNFIGALGGSLAGFVGALTGWLTSRGRARAFVLALQWVMLGLGVLSLLIAGVALSLRQPWHVPVPLLILGTILVSVAPVVLGQSRRRYRDLELRRMAALDAV